MHIHAPIKQGEYLYLDETVLVEQYKASLFGVAFEKEKELDVEFQAETEEFNRYVHKEAFSTLTEHEGFVLRMRFGFGYAPSSFDFGEFTLEDISSLLKVSKERIRQIESSAIKKLKHPRNCRTVARLFMTSHIEYPNEKRVVVCNANYSRSKRGKRYDNSSIIKRTSTKNESVNQEANKEPFNLLHTGYRDFLEAFDLTLKRELLKEKRSEERGLSSPLDKVEKLPNEPTLDKILSAFIAPDRNAENLSKLDLILEGCFQKKRSDDEIIAYELEKAQRELEAKSRVNYCLL